MRVGVLASGAGTNLQAILDRLHGRHGIEVVAVGSDQPGAPALDRAARAGVPTGEFPLARTASAGVPIGESTPRGPESAGVPTGASTLRGPASAGVPIGESPSSGAPSAGAPTASFPADRAHRDAAIADFFVGHGVDLVVLAGYMALLTPGFLARFPGRVINVHPALLPAFPGLHAIEQALDYGVKVFGVTVHFVDEGVDTGPIIAQGAIELPDATSPTEVREALRPLEHDLLCEAIALIARGAVHSDPADPRHVTVER